MQDLLRRSVMPQLFEGFITREDIAVVAASEQLILDDERISVLEAMRSIDVQACPGSGKTTLIATKLILLAKNWPFQDQGVCVLSHTNVAKDEIIERLKSSNTIEAQRLLNYPHFIGTIQEFANRFLALPFIRSNGVRDITVDNDVYGKIAEKLLNLGRFRWFKGTLNGLGDNDAQVAFLRGTFRFISQDVEVININKKPRAWRLEANLQRAERDLRTLKQYLDERGIYLFRDMYTHAQKVYSLNTELGKALIERFPFVFVDEMQDTQKYQDELLCDIFPLDDPNLIVQRFGDPDQAIFHGIGSEEPNESFNGKSSDDMDFLIHKSHRFDVFLADKIKFLSLSEIPLESELLEQALADRTDAHATGGNFEHTIIVFNEDTRDSVVKYFAGIVSSQFSTQHKRLQQFTVKVVGAVGNEINLTIDQLKIGHYWPDYDKSKSKTNFKATSLVEAVRYCRQSSSTDWADNYKYLIDCILIMMRMAGNLDENERYFSSSTLRVALKNDDSWESFRDGIYMMLNDDYEIGQQFWDDICRHLTVVLKLENVPVAVTEYMAFTEEIVPDVVTDEDENQEDTYVAPLPDNKISHSDGFDIELSTIHSVKGETHDATLIVETKNHTFDLETMLPYLTGDLPSDDHPNSRLPPKPNSRRAFKPNKVFMRQFYVAMSRPKHLLCLALHSDRISDAQRRLLKEKEWKVDVLN